MVATSCRRQRLSGPVCAWTPHRFYPPMGVVGERREFDIKPLLEAPLQIFPRCYLLKSFPQGDTSARQREFEIRAYPLIGELPKVEPRQSICQLLRWKLGPTMWSSPTTKSLDPVVATALLVDLPGRSLVPTTGGLPAIVMCQRRGLLLPMRQKNSTHISVVSETTRCIGNIS